METNKTILITGSTSGIGEQLLRNLDQYYRSSTFILLGRNQDKLEEIKLTLHNKCEIILVDLGEVGILRYKLNHVLSRYKIIDKLILAAGIADQSLVGTLSTSKIQQIVNVNLVSTIELTNIVVPHMKSSGAIVIISSLMGKIGYPSMATYSATKFGLVGFAESLKYELQSRGISVLTILPTLVSTPMTANFNVNKNVYPLTPELAGYRIANMIKSNSNGEIALGLQAHLAILAKKLFPAIVDLFVS